MTELDVDRRDEEITRLHNENVAALLTIAALKNDLEIIGKELKQEAEARGWCSDYRAFVESVNAQCSDAHLLPCSQRWRIEYVVRVEVSAEDNEAIEQQLYGELQLADHELEAGTLHRCDVTLTSRTRVDE